MKAKQIDPSIEPTSLEDEQLLMAHMVTHAYYKEFRMGRGKDGWELEEVIQTHHDIRDEIEQREDLNHDYISGLDNEAEDAQVDQMSVQMAHKDDAAKEWVSSLIESEDVKQHIRENPPESEWYLRAVQFAQQEDETLDLTQHISFTAQSYDTLDESVQDWVQDVTQESRDVVAYYLNEDTEVGVLLSQSDGEYEVNIDSYSATTTDEQVDALTAYQEATQLVKDGARADYALNEVNQADNWVVPEAPKHEDVKQSEETEITLESFAQTYGYGEDAEWDDFSEEDKETVTQSFAVSASGSPAKAFEDLAVPTHTPDGRLMLDAVRASREDNAKGDVETPANLRDEVETRLATHIEQGQIAESAADGDGRWYVWDQAGINNWFDDNNITQPAPEQDGDFQSYRLGSSEGYEIVQTEWTGRTWAPHTFIEELDDKPVLIQWGKESEDDMQADLLAVKFLVEVPAEYEDTEIAQRGSLRMEQFGKVDTSLDWYWWEWSEGEINVWLNEQGHASTLNQEYTDQGFMRVTLESEDQFDTLTKRWKGKRRPPSGDDTIAGGEKPRRVVYGGNGEDRTVQAIEFLVDSVKNDKA